MKLNPHQEAIMITAKGLGTIGFEAEHMSVVTGLGLDTITQDSDELVTGGFLKKEGNLYVYVDVPPTYNWIPPKDSQWRNWASA